MFQFAVELELRTTEGAPFPAYYAAWLKLKVRERQIREGAAPKKQERKEEKEEEGGNYRKDCPQDDSGF